MRAPGRASTDASTLRVAVVAMLGVFSIVNWQALMAPVALDLIVAKVTAPLGVAMLGAVAVLTLLYLLFLVWLETKALLQFGRADSRAETERSMRDIVARLEHVEQALKDEVGRVSDLLTAQVNRTEPHVKRAG